MHFTLEWRHQGVRIARRRRCPLRSVSAQSLAMIQVSNMEWFRRIATLVGGVGIVVVAMLIAIRAKSREHDKRQAIWRRFALDNRLNLKVEPDSWLKLGEMRISGRIGELDLDLTTYRVKVGKSTQTWVRVLTKGNGPEGNFNIERKSIFSRAGALLGAKHDSVDEGSFDENFLTHSTPASLARDVFDAALRAHFASLTREPKLDYADGKCELTWHCGEESIEQLSAAVKLHAMLRGAFARMNRR